MQQRARRGCWPSAALDEPNLSPDVGLVRLLLRLAERVRLPRLLADNLHLRNVGNHADAHADCAPQAPWLAPSTLRR
ncbi:hypothetical protein GA0115260_120798 [Streptomyces sp. MnatMP-M27]|nr:hypothetical protein GA0115260_120798 [Streptomyces sp. MnatMP-M27]